MRHFLHNPVRDISIVQGYITNNQPEGEQLDFKSVPWLHSGMPKEKKKEVSLETAKDIAAFANHLGGDIIIGVIDKNDCANAWKPLLTANVSDIRHDIHQALINHLRPHEFVELVEIIDLPAPTPDHSILIVSIPPSPELVAVEDRESDKSTLLFPIRTGRRTRSLIYEEVMLRTSVTSRNTYIKLYQLLDQANSPHYIRFSSLVVGSNGHQKYPVVAETGSHAIKASLSLDTLTVTMREVKTIGTLANTVGTPGNLIYIMKPEDIGHSLTIPLDLIRTAWSQERIGHVTLLCLALDAEIVWNGQTWYLITSRS